MYRISTPNLLLLLIIILIGSLFTSATPSYFGGTRVLSFVSLIIGELGMSFIPVIALYPKANPTQSIILAIIFFISTFIVCVSSWAVNSLGWPGSYSFQWKDGEFFVNTYSLFISNIVSLISLIINFKLVYDEELTKDLHKGRNRPSFNKFKKTIINRPQHSPNEVAFSQSVKNKQAPSPQRFKDDDDFGKPFDFSPEASEISKDKLPEESSGELFVNEEIKEDVKTFDFEDSLSSLDEFPFSNEPTPPEPIKEVKKPEKIERPKPINIESSVKIPGDIKNDLAAIFEQYSSLNAVKKLTSDVSSRHKFKREKRKEKISITINDPDIQEASYRPVSENEELEKIKENLKDDLRSELKEELIQSFRNELEPIKDIKEIKKQYEPSSRDKELINSLNQIPEVQGAFIISQSGDVLLEDWKNTPEDFNDIKISISSLFSKLTSKPFKTKQGNLNHLILQGNNGSFILAGRTDSILGVHSTDDNTSSGQILRTLTESEDSEDDE